METRSLYRVVQALECLTGLTVSCYDARFRVMFPWKPSDAPSEPPWHCSRFCEQLHTACQGSWQLCHSSDLNAFHAAQETRSVCAYTCPFGLLEAVVPISQGDRIIGYLMMGKALPAQADAKARTLESLHGLLSERTDPIGLTEELDRLPRLTAAQWEAYQDALSIFATYIETNDLLVLQPKTLGQLTKEYVRQHYRGKLTLDELSLQLHCSTVTLTKHFRREFGTTVFSYINDQRMRCAEQLLTNSDLPISEVAESSGFSDANYFFRLFKARHGVSPTAYRKNSRTDSDSTADRA